MDSCTDLYIEEPYNKALTTRAPIPTGSAQSGWLKAEWFHQPSALGHGAKMSGTWHSPLLYTALVTVGRAATMRSRGYHSNGADNRELVQEPKQSLASLRGVIGRTNVDGMYIPDYDSIIIMDGADVTPHWSTPRSTPARSDTSKHSGINGRVTQMHSRGMRTTAAQGVHHVEIGLEHRHTYSKGYTLAAEARQDRAGNADGVMLRTYAHRHGHQGRPTLISSSVNG